MATSGQLIGRAGLIQSLGRMKSIAASVIGLLLAACGQTTPEPFDFSKEGIDVLPGCPALPGVDAVRIISDDGPDF